MKSALLGIIGLLASAAAIADTWGPSTGHTITNVRVYPEGSLVIQFSPALSAGCQYNDHTVTPSTSANHKLISSMAMAAHLSQKKVQIIYNGCGNPINNVNVTGLIVL